MYFKLAPGVRVRVGSRGVRTSIGPRAARVHIGGGYRPGVSTGAGPVTLYHSVGGTRRRRPRSASHGQPGAATVAAYHRQAAAAAKSAEAQQITAALAGIESLHRHPAEPVSPPVGPDEPPADEDAIRRRAQSQALAGIRFWRRAERRAARQEAERRAQAEIAAARAEREHRHQQAQTELDARWNELRANDPEVTMATLAEAFEDNEMHAAPLSVHGAEATLAVIVPGEEIVPNHRPTTTQAGNLSLQKMTKTDRSGWYLTAVCGHVLAAVRETFAVAPGLESSRVAAVRVGPPDAYGHPRSEVLLVATFTRGALSGIDWAGAPSPDVVQQAATDLSANFAGRVKQLQPLDLTDEPELGALLAAIDVETEGAHQH